MPSLQHPALVAILLEEAMPQCVIEGIDYTDTEKYSQMPRPELPPFLQQSMEHLKEEMGVHKEDLEQPTLIGSGSTQ